MSGRADTIIFKAALELRCLFIVKTGFSYCNLHFPDTLKTLLSLQLTDVSEAFNVVIYS